MDGTVWGYASAVCYVGSVSALLAVTVLQALGIENEMKDWYERRYM